VRILSEPVSILIAIKLLHTVIWFFFVCCIFAIPILGMRRQFRRAAILAALVAAECVVVAFNHFRCPLTDLAARYTDDRRINFDIFLPDWLAQYNQMIFGTLFVAGGLFVLCKWLRSRHN